MAFSSAFGWARSTEDFHWHRVHEPVNQQPDAPPAKVHAACGVEFAPDGAIVRTKPTDGVCEACATTA